MPDSRATELTRVGKKLFSDKRQWDELCQDIAENIYPMRADFTTAFTLGEDFSENLFDSTPVQARETLGNMPEAMLRQGEWFKAQVDDEGLNEKHSEWLEAQTKAFREDIYNRNANFNTTMKIVDHDWVSFGSAALSIEETPDRRNMLFRSWHLKDCAWMEDDSGHVDRLHRNMKKTSRNIMRSPWAKKAHSDIKTAANSDPSKEFNVQHIVLPLDEIYGDDKERRREAQGNEWVSIYIDIEHEEVLSEGFLPIFNYSVPRWRKVGGFPFGFSPPAINSLPDNRMLQHLSRLILEQGEKAVDPPIVLKGDVFTSDINLYASGATMADLGEGEKIRDVMDTIATGDAGVGEAMKADVRGLIAEAFLLNKLTLPNEREMTAFEMQQRVEEYRRNALPFFGPVESEVHEDVLGKAFPIWLNGKPEVVNSMPEDLEGREIVFDFDSPLASAEGRKNVAAYQESIQIIAGAAQFDETIVGEYDVKKMTRDAVKGTGAEADWTKSGEELKQAEKESAQAERLKQTAGFLQEGAGVAGDVADASLKLQEAGLQ